MVDQQSKTKWWRAAAPSTASQLFALPALPPTSPRSLLAGSANLSRRQRVLYDEFMARSSTRSSLASGNYMHIINIVMQLRKVCNHPNLFAEPCATAPLVLPALDVPALPRLLFQAREADPFAVSPTFLNFNFLYHECMGLN